MENYGCEDKQQQQQHQQPQNRLDGETIRNQLDGKEWLDTTNLEGTCKENEQSTLQRLEYVDAEHQDVNTELGQVLESSNSMVKQAGCFLKAAATVKNIRRTLFLSIWIVILILSIKASLLASGNLGTDIGRQGSKYQSTTDRTINNLLRLQAFLQAIEEEEEEGGFISNRGGTYSPQLNSFTTDYENISYYENVTIPYLPANSSDGFTTSPTDWDRRI
jgi:hypothetical protein